MGDIQSQVALELDLSTYWIVNSYKLLKKLSLFEFVTRN